MTTTPTRREGPSELAPGESPSSDIPAKYRRLPRSTRSANRLIWSLIAAMFLLIVLALIGLARAPRTGSLGPHPPTFEGGALVRGFTFTELGEVRSTSRGVRAVPGGGSGLEAGACG